jgi:hypothetical protein
MATTKGTNWALPEDTGRATGITRPILVECHPDRLVIPPDRRDPRPPQVIPLVGPTSSAMERFVASIWKHTERWGMAVAGGYWKPILRVEVFPGAETRFRELKTLLDRSGIEVEKR